MNINKIKENLTRQYKALSLLLELLNEEYIFILKREKEYIGRNELSIQNLMAQIFEERKEFKNFLIMEFGTENINEFLNRIGSEKKEIERLINEIMNKEQECKLCAQRNADLIIALLDQTKELLNNLTQTVQNQISEHRVYSSKGEVETKEVSPIFLDGRC